MRPPASMPGTRDRTSLRSATTAQARLVAVKPWADIKDQLQQRKQDLENEFAQETGKLQGELDAGAAVIDQVQVKARKSDIDVMAIALLWVPV